MRRKNPFPKITYLLLRLRSKVHNNHWEGVCMQQCPLSQPFVGSIISSDAAPTNCTPTWSAAGQTCASLTERRRERRTTTKKALYWSKAEREMRRKRCSRGAAALLMIGRWAGSWRSHRRIEQQVAGHRRGPFKAEHTRLWMISTFVLADGAEDGGQ